MQTEFPHVEWYALSISCTDVICGLPLPLMPLFPVLTPCRLPSLSYRGDACRVACARIFPGIVGQHLMMPSRSFLSAYTVLMTFAFYGTNFATLIKTRIKMACSIILIEKESDKIPQDAVCMTKHQSGLTPQKRTCRVLLPQPVTHRPWQTVELTSFLRGEISLFLIIGPLG